MDIREPIKRALKMCGHAFVVTVHERLDNIERHMGYLAETQTSLLRAAIDSAEKQHNVTAGFQFGEPDEGLMAFLYSYLPDRTAIDVGANVGDVSACLIRAGYEVYAFEPNPPVYEKLVTRLGDAKGFHAFSFAIGCEEGERSLHLAEDRSHDQIYRDATVLSTLAIHDLPEDLAFTGAVQVSVKNLAALHQAGAIPEAVSLVKIDTEGFDLEVIRGMGEHRYPVVVAEYWDPETPLGPTHPLENLVREMRERGYMWHIVLYRIWMGPERGYYSNYSQSVPNSWGNVFFFREHTVFARAQEWCAAVLPRANFR